MGLRFPADLDAWQRWQDRRNTPRRIVKALRGGDRSPAPDAFLARRGEGDARVLAVLESRAASSRLAILAPLDHLDAPAAVLSPFDPSPYLGPPWRVEPAPTRDLATLLPRLEVVLSAAHYLPLGASAWQDAEARGHLYVTVQHGLLTPSSPPLPAHGQLLAWSEGDAEFWRSGRADVVATVVGSQLLWDAAEVPCERISRFERPTFLGQLHGAELPRSGMVRAASTLCRETGATYRPHPSETDRLSRLQHAAWQRAGITIDRSGIPLTESRQPVISAFSTGILEAAARGIPSWAFYPDAPPWLVEFWRRYGMAQWGEPPTPAPAASDLKPAAAIGNWVKERL